MPNSQSHGLAGLLKAGLALALSLLLAVGMTASEATAASSAKEDAVGKAASSPGKKAATPGKRKERPRKESSANAPKPQSSVYEGQASVSERELTSFLRVLPSFRGWARQNREEASPIVYRGQPDFQYSEKAAQWVKSQGWEPRRFFCIMGRMAAALVIVEEGYDMGADRPPDMPAVSNEELEVVRRNLGVILKTVSSFN